MIKKLAPLCLLLTVLAIGCKKETTSKCLQVKYIRATCAGIVIQALNDSTIGDDGWADMFDNNKRYDNVFSAFNSCKIPSEYKVGDIFYVKIEKPKTTDCVLCTMYDAPPKTAYEVKLMGNLPCDNTPVK